MSRRSGLGRGLGSLIPTEVVAEQGSALREVPIADIRPNPLQPRSHFEEEAMASLAASIREMGVLQPILVRDLGSDEYELIAGERRWRAARRAGLQTIPVIVQRTVEAQSLEQALVENLHREDLSPLEEAAAYQQLIEDFDHTHDQVAKRVGKSRTTVTNTLRLLQLPAGVQQALSEGAITAGHARALLGTPDRVFQEQMAKRILAEDLSVRAVEQEIRKLVHGSEEPAEDEDRGGPASSVAGPDASSPSSSSVRKLPAPGVLELEELLADYLNTRVKVDVGSKHGRVIVDFATIEDLERIYKLMVGGQSIEHQHSK